MAAHKFSVGDKVRFLYEKGEGIVRGFDGKLVRVEMDGFIIPYVPEQLVLITTPEKAKAKDEKVREFVKPYEDDRHDSFKVTESVYVAYENKGNENGFFLWLIN